MLNTSQNFMTVALPKTKGTHRVGTHLSQLLDSAGVSILEPAKERQDDCLYGYTSGPDIRFRGMHASSSDCADYLLDNVVDAAVIGLNRLVNKVLERGDDPADIVCLPLNMQETSCRVVFAKAVNDNDDTRQYNRVLASHPSIAQQYFKQEGISVGKIIPKDGSLETAGRALYGGCPIVDITQTGNSLRANDYKISKTIMSSEAVLAWKPRGFDFRSSVDYMAETMGLSARNRRPLKTLPIFAQK